MLGLSLKNAIIGCECFFQAAEIAQRVGPVVAEGGRARVEREPALIARESVLQPVQLLQGGSAIDKRAEMIAPNGKRGIIASERLIKAVEVE